MSWSGNARLNAQRDKNERLIIETLEKRGFVVCQINGKGVPDLLVASMGRCWLVEVKQPKGKLNAAQQKWHARWTGPAPIILRSVEDALVFPAVEESK